MATVLLIEDEESLVAALRYNLAREGHEVIAVTEGPAGLDLARRQRPDAVVLDVMLPGMDGFTLCRILRSESTVPILILTARAEEVDRVVGLELGADDYLTKPFSMREFLARVRALLRRSAMSQPGTQTPAGRDVRRAGDLEVDLTSHVARRAGQELKLRPKEFDLLSFLMRNPGHAFTREQLLERVWGYDFSGDSRTVDVHMRWLREKIESDPANPRRIITIRGVGYRLEG